MKFSKTVRYQVRVREYETAVIEAGAEITNYDVGLDDNEVAQLSEQSTIELWRNMKDLVVHQVELLSRDELQRVAAISEFQPNLADDVLSSSDSQPRRRSNAGNPPSRASQSPSSRRVRR